MKFQTLFLFKCVTFSVSYALNPKNNIAGFKFRRDITRVLEENMINIIFVCFVKSIGYWCVNCNLSKNHMKCKVSEIRAEFLREKFFEY